LTSVHLKTGGIWKRGRRKPPNLLAQFMARRLDNNQKYKICEINFFNYFANHFVDELKLLEESVHEQRKMTLHYRVKNGISDDPTKTVTIDPSKYSG
jgi:hypothetical protein